METIVILNIILNHVPSMTLERAYQFAHDLQTVAGNLVSKGWTPEMLSLYLNANNEWRTMWETGHKIQVIKEVRGKCNLGLKEAKEACEKAYGSYA